MDFSDLPSISILLQNPALQEIEHSFAVRVAREAVQSIRKQIVAGKGHSVCWETILHETKIKLTTNKYKRVINGTGIVIHTNLGRAPMSSEVLDYVRDVSMGYCNLEVNLATGQRGGRLDEIERLLQELTGCDSGLAVNNNAAATMLALSALAEGKEVIVSRGELVEIGGSFRIPDVISTGGAKLVEVGTTNRTRVGDFERAITEKTGAFLRVHPSNYRVVGFSQRVPREDLVALSQKYDIPLIEDVGSGLLSNAPNVPWAEELEAEESIQKALSDGVDLVSFSGDKLLGGPQSGMVVGRKDLVEKCAKHPLYRAIRLDKMVLAALEKTLRIYREGRERQLPIWKMLEHSAAQCKQVAEKMSEMIPGAIVEEDVSFSGGGALPNRSLPSHVVVLRGDDIVELARKLRSFEPSIFVRIQKQSLRIDPRTLLDEEWEIVVHRINALRSEQDHCK